MNTGTRNYAIVTAAYWGFTLTDGALRMLVLLHFYRLGYSPFTLAFLFLLYEAMGMVANLIGGWLATRYGIARMLAVGLATQITGFLLLSALSPTWTAAMSVAWVVLAQGICGVAKDLTKTASKSAIKLTAGSASGQLFKWVAFFTGSKNAMKGVGFFLGGLLLQALGFQAALWTMAGAAGAGVRRRGRLRAAADGQEQGLEVGQGTVRQEPRHQPAGRRARGAVRRARRLVRGRRAGVPVCLGLDLHDGRRLPGAVDHRLWRGAGPRARAGAPQRRRPEPRGARGAAVVGAAGPGADRPGRAGGREGAAPANGWWSPGWALFGFAFAVNSSVHSYLILAYAGSEKAAEDVGFYYAANALGRFFGTLLSGLLYQWGGLLFSLIGSAAMLIACWLITLALPTAGSRMAGAAPAPASVTTERRRTQSLKASRSHP